MTCGGKGTPLGRNGMTDSLLSSFQGKRVLVTGHTGFKGAWLSEILLLAGADVMGYSLTPPTNPSLFELLGLEKRMRSVISDIRDYASLKKAFDEFQPEFVFHLAAQPIVRASYREPLYTYETNVMGTANVLECVRLCPSVRSVVNITTDKVYFNPDVPGHAFQEDEPLDGYDPYSNSKSCSELVTHSYKRSFFDPISLPVSTCRAGNVIGGGDWALDRLVPDCVRSINDGIKIEIRNPVAVRPWQHVLEPLSGYMLLGEKLYTEGKKYAEGFNFGPHEDSVLTVADVAQKIVGYYGNGEVVVHKRDDLHEAGLLMLSIKKAARVLGWKPVLTAEEAIENSVEWYRRFYAGEEMTDFTLRQIDDYQRKAKL